MSDTFSGHTVDTNWRYTNDIMDLTGALDGENPYSAWIHGLESTDLLVDGVSLGSMNPDLVESVNILREGLVGAIAKQPPGLLNTRDPYLVRYFEERNAAIAHINAYRSTIIGRLNSVYNRNVFSDRRQVEKYVETDMPEKLAQEFLEKGNDIGFEVSYIPLVNPTHKEYPTLIRGRYAYQKAIPQSDASVLVDFSVLNQGEAVIVFASRVLGPVPDDIQQKGADEIKPFLNSLKNSGVKKVYFYNDRGDDKSIVEMTFFKKNTRKKINQLPKSFTPFKPIDP